MPRLSRPALIISACIFVCALVMLCLAQFSAARASVDLSGQAPAHPLQMVQLADASDTAGKTLSGVSAASLSFDISSELSAELSEPMLPGPAAMLSGISVARPAAPATVALPHPLIKGPQRPPRALFA